MLDQIDHEQTVEQYSFYQRQNHLREQAVFSYIWRLVTGSYKIWTMKYRWYNRIVMTNFN